MKLFNRIFLSIYLCMLLFFTHTIHSFAAPSLISSVVVTPQSSGPIYSTVSLPKYSCILGGGYTQGGPTTAYNYYNDSYTFDWYYRLGNVIYNNDSSFPRNYSPPSGCDTYVFRSSSVSASGVTTSSVISGNDGYLTGLSVIPTVSVAGLVIDGVEYPFINNFVSPYLKVGPYFSTDSIIIHCQITYVIHGYTQFKGVCDASNVPQIKLGVNVSSISWYKGGSDSSSGDITALGNNIAQETQQQTESLQNGFDNSAGNSAADQISTEVDDYLKTEDALYDQMQYEVPEVDIASDGQAIILASNFLQSLYVSDSFISKCVTFVLTFGLIMYIVGYLKKGT